MFCLEKEFEDKTKRTKHDERTYKANGQNQPIFHFSKAFHFRTFTPWRLPDSTSAEGRLEAIGRLEARGFSVISKRSETSTKAVMIERRAVVEKSQMNHQVGPIKTAGFSHQKYRYV